jgi:hypothetical protein
VRSIKKIYKTCSNISEKMITNICPIYANPKKSQLQIQPTLEEQKGQILDVNSVKSCSPKTDTIHSRVYLPRVKYMGGH